MLSTALDTTMLQDDVIELRLIRFMEVGDLSRRRPGTEFLGAAPEYRFAIHRRTDGLRVGRIHFRITNEPEIVDVLGHMGYAVDEAYRGQGYAARAISLATAAAARLGQGELWVHIEPDNASSRRAIGCSGFELVEEVDAKAPGLALGLGPRLCRYRRAIET